VATGLDALEFVLAGASAVAVGTALFHDPTAGPRILRELEEALNARRIGRLADAVGLAHRLPPQGHAGYAPPQIIPPPGPQERRAEDSKEKLP
jgi:dihydroorotate dehydrogenase (NAD+) catalytic subunit